MAVIATTRSAPAVHVSGGLTKLVSRIVAWNDARVTRKALSQLSDRQLEDIGMTRADIDTFSA